MPFWEETRKMWRGQVKFQGQRFRADFHTKREALDWEVKKRQELKLSDEKKTLIGMDLGDFFNKYLDHAQLRFIPKTFVEKRSLCIRFLDMIGNGAVSRVTTEDVHRYLSIQARVRSANVFNRDRKNLSAMWTWGVKILGLQNNPVINIDKLPHSRAPQYTPTAQEVLKLLAVATREEAVLLKSILNTGARKSEIFRWTWLEDINFEKREVRLGTRKTKDGSMEYEWLPMNEDLYDNLWWLWNNRKVKDTPHVFVSSSKTPGRHYGKPYTEHRWLMHNLCKRANIHPFGFHALRRFVASYLADNHKISAKTIQRVLRHKNVMTTERYIQNINHDLGAIMELLSEKGPQAGSPTQKKKG